MDVAPFLSDETIETTGAGDTFCGCVIHYILESGLDTFDEAKLREMLIVANGAASLITRVKGALKVMPEIKDIEELIKNR